MPAMSEGFDPYLQWLGIRDPQRPPNHYRLLGIELFESDPDVISNAVDRQMAHVRTFQTGPHAAESQRVLNELAGAKVCLLNPKKKALYDAQLAADLAALRVSGGKAASGSSPAASAAGPPVPSRRAQRLALLWVAASVLVAMGVVLTVVMVFMLGSGRSRTDKRGAWAFEQPQDAGAVTERDRVPQIPPKAAGQPKFLHEPKTGLSKEAASPAKATQAAGEGPKPAVKSEPKPPAKPLPLVRQSIPAVRTPRKDRDPAAAKKHQESVDQPAVPRAPARLPVPDEAAQKAARSEVREVYRVQFAQAKTPIDKGLLAGELLREARETQDNPAVRYLLLTEARDLAIQGGDPGRLREIVSEMAQSYQLDALQEQTRAYSVAAEMALPSLVRTSLARAAVQLAREAIQADAYEAAGQLAKAGFSLASKVMATKGRDLQTIRQANELIEMIPWYREQHQLAQRAQKALAQDADNPEAILILGKYYALVKNEWPRGLPLLAKASDPTWKALAEAELEMSRSAEPADMVRMADQWIEALRSIEAPMQRFARQRALYWYETALPRLGGFTQSRVARAVLDLKEGEMPRRKP